MGQHARAEDLARRLDARLLLVHVVEPLAVPVAYGLEPAVYVDYEDAATTRARRSLDGTVRAIEARGGRARALVVPGTAAAQICELAAKRKVDLVVLATHGYTGLKHALLGSTAERVVRGCPCPVLTVKATKARPAARARRARSAPGPRRAA
jgi:universal stress protein A